MSVDAGKSRAALSAGVDQIAPVIGLFRISSRHQIRRKSDPHKQVILLKAITISFPVQVLSDTHLLPRADLLSQQVQRKEVESDDIEDHAVHSRVEAVHHALVLTGIGVVDPQVADLTEHAP